MIIGWIILVKVLYVDLLAESFEGILKIIGCKSSMGDEFQIETEETFDIGGRFSKCS